MLITAHQSRVNLSVIFAALVMVCICGCGKQQPRQTESGQKPQAAWQNLVLQERQAKDAEFKSGDSSPIPGPEKNAFQGLSYYPINPDLAFSVALHRYPGPKQIKLATNTGEIRRGLRYGYFDFLVEGQRCQLQVYRLEDTSGSAALLFVPFRDSTSGHETYSAGRYIDLQENTSGVYDLNFNRAYNPYCAYNSEFSCPVPPAENNLPVPIHAGEKKYVSNRKN